MFQVSISPKIRVNVISPDWALQNKNNLRRGAMNWLLCLLTSWCQVKLETGSGPGCLLLAPTQRGGRDQISQCCQTSSQTSRTPSFKQTPQTRDAVNTLVFNNRFALAALILSCHEHEVKSEVPHISCPCFNEPLGGGEWVSTCYPGMFCKCFQILKIGFSGLTELVRLDYARGTVRTNACVTSQDHVTRNI